MKKKHNYQINIPNQPSPEGWGWKKNWKPANITPLEEEQKRKQRFKKLAGQRNILPKK